MQNMASSTSMSVQHSYWYTMRSNADVNTKLKKKRCRTLCYILCSTVMCLLKYSKCRSFNRSFNVFCQIGEERFVLGYSAQLGNSWPRLLLLMIPVSNLNYFNAKKKCNLPNNRTRGAGIVLHALYFPPTRKVRGCTRLGCCRHMQSRSAAFGPDSPVSQTNQCGCLHSVLLSDWLWSLNILNQIPEVLKLFGTLIFA